ncbi:MAG: hypothetical protein Q8Q28_09030 [Pseudomonadota bacterium]|nr:hypothetical protein [Pseudomonadota bacterium]
MDIVFLPLLVWNKSRRLGKAQRAQPTAAMLGTLRFAQPTITTLPD